MININSLCNNRSSTGTAYPVMDGLKGSMILGIASEVRTLQSQGREICNLTIGDFRPQHFPIPEELAEEVAKAYKDGQTNYPPSDGVPELKEAIDNLYQRKFGLQYGSNGICVASGARPPLYASWNLSVGRGERSVSFLPAWNNGYYAHLRQSNHHFVRTSAQSNFHPTVEQIKEVLPKTNLIALNSPLNPTGTVISKDVLKGIAEAIVEENQRRSGRPVLLMFDQVYWMLLEEGQEHFSPVQLVPEIAPYVIHIDAISKCFAATGLRVGWGVLPEYLQPKMKALIGHMGAWAARPEQLATARFLQKPELVQKYMRQMQERVSTRLRFLYDGIMAMQKKGIPVNAIAPQGAIYLSFRVDLIGDNFKTNDDIRRFLLLQAGVAVVPFQAFDMKEESGWFRMSVGAVGLEDLQGALDRIEKALQDLS
jgi:aspartate aminotransferase